VEDKGQMDTGIKMLFILSATPFMNLILHMISTRVFRDSSHHVVAIKSILLGYILLFFPLWLLISSDTSYPSYKIFVALFYCFIVYTLLSYTYFHFFNMSETARRIKILYEIYRAGSLTKKEMASVYSASDMINIRLKRLVSMRQLKYTDGFFSLEKKTLYWAGLILVLWREILGLKRGSG